MRRRRHSLSNRHKKQHHFPVAALLLTLTFLAVFIVQQFNPGTEMITRWGLIPERFWDHTSLGHWWSGTDRWTPLTAIALHLDWIHLLSNLAFFWLFAQRIERRSGWFRFALLVLVCGTVANLYEAWKVPELAVPIIGASGATAGLFGAFLVLYPTAQIGIILPLGLYWQVTRVPGILLIGTWLAIQFGYILASEYFDAAAWWAHLAGFATGLILTLIARMLAGLRR